MKPTVKQELNPALVRPLILVAMLWGFLLNGFFLYVPYMTGLGQVGESALATAIGWLVLCVVAIVVGRNYHGILSKRGPRRITAFVVVALAAIGVILDSVVAGPWGWIALSAALSITLSFLTYRIVGANGSHSLAKASALLGATPPIGLLLVSSTFSFAFVQNFFPALAGASVLIAIIDIIATPTQPHSSGDDASRVNILPSSLLSYGFLLGFGVALVNTNVYARIAEVIGGESSVVARLSSQLIFLASLVGVIASLVVGLRMLENFPRVALARLATAVVSLGVLVLILAEGIIAIGIAGFLVGIGFGLTNGVELRLVQAASAGSRERTALFGSFLAATTLPYGAAAIAGIQIAAVGWGTTPILVTALIASFLGLVSIRTKLLD
jgi:predicted MFS family arabinose efflux permease